MKKKLLILFFGVLGLTVLVTMLLVSIFERQQEKKLTHFKIIEVKLNEPDPAVWGTNFPAQYERYLKTMDSEELLKYSRFGRYGGSEAFSKLDRYPEMRRLFAGYSFAVEYNEERGHLMALEDLLAIRRLGDDKPGTCLTCKSSHVPGIISEIGPDEFYATPLSQLMDRFAVKHAISCADCHDSETMALRITRPAFREAMARRGIDVDRAERTEMRAYACAQCHVEYHFGRNNYLVFPWDQGLSIEDIESYYDELGFKDWVHRETGAEMVKMQHPEFELWSSGIHARAGVSCVDCHMPYMRQGAIKVTDHWLRTPLANPATSCASCHRLADEELRSRVLQIQDRTYHLLIKAQEAIVAAQDAMLAAKAGGVPDQELDEARRLQRRAFMRWDFISAENSMGFHSPQEAVRILGDAIDYARLAQISAINTQRK